jgi:hypothetical protein
MCKRRSHRADAATCELTQSLQSDGDGKLGILPKAVPRETDKVGFDYDAVRRSRQFDPHGFVDDPRITRKQRQRPTFVAPDTT